MLPHSLFSFGKVGSNESKRVGSGEKAYYIPPSIPPLNMVNDNE